MRIIMNSYGAFSKQMSSGKNDSTQCGRVTQICVFTLQLCRTGDANLHFLHGETRYICKFSLVPLHKGECFQRYHILKHY
jgi:hypothetical protein